MATTIVRPEGPPVGWFEVCGSDDLGSEQLTGRRWVDRRVVAWRSVDYAAHVMDAYCPHFGADMSCGGRIVGHSIQCPFHGWAFDTSGRNVAVPGQITRHEIARVRRFPTVEGRGGVLAWNGPESSLPAWEPDDELTLKGHDKVGPVVVRRTIRATLLMIGENYVDADHFSIVHRNRARPVIDAVFDGPRADLTIALGGRASHGRLLGVMKTVFHGPGLITQTFDDSGIVVYTHATPTSAEWVQLVQRFYHVRGDRPRHARLALVEDFARRAMLGISQDQRIWEHLQPLAEPAIEDDMIRSRFREWFASFLTEANESSSSSDT